MARRVPPGQLPLFGELPRTAPPPPPARLLALPQGEDSDAPAPGELFAAPDRAVPEGWTEAGAFEAPPAAAADRLVMAVPVSGRSGGSILAAIRQAERIVLDDAAPFALFVSVLDFGRFDSIDADETEAIIGAGDSVEMRRFEASFTSVGSRDEGGMALFANDGGLGELADCLHGALRERGAPVAHPDRNGVHLRVGTGGAAASIADLDRPVRLPVREFALIRAFGAGEGYEILRKWPLAA